MLLTSFHLITVTLIGSPRLCQKIKQLGIFLMHTMQVKLELDEKILIVEMAVFEKAHIAFLFLIDLHVTVVAHYAFVKTAR